MLTLENISRDVAGIILDKLTYIDCKNFSMCNNNLNRFCDEKYFYNRTMRMYQSTIKNKRQTTWRKHVMEIENYIERLQYKYNHKYNDDKDKNPRLLFRAKFITRQREFTFNNALIEACKISDLELVEYLIDLGADVNVGLGLPVESVCQSGRSEANQLEILKYLMKKGLDLKNTYQLLSVAASRNRFEIVKYLIENNCPNSENGMALVNASDNGNLKMVKLLTKHYNPHGGLAHAISRATKKGHIDVVKYLEQFV